MPYMYGEPQFVPQAGDIRLRMPPQVSMDNRPMPMGVMSHPTVDRAPMPPEQNMPGQRPGMRMQGPPEWSQAGGRKRRRGQMDSGDGMQDNRPQPMPAMWGALVPDHQQVAGAVLGNLMQQNPQLMQALAAKMSGAPQYNDQPRYMGPPASDNGMQSIQSALAQLYGSPQYQAPQPASLPSIYSLMGLG